MFVDDSRIETGDLERSALWQPLVQHEQPLASTSLALYLGRMGGEERFSPPVQPGYKASTSSV